MVKTDFAPIYTGKPFVTIRAYSRAAVYGLATVYLRTLKIWCAYFITLLLRAGFDGHNTGD
jgi:hypothetical protein